MRIVFVISLLFAVTVAAKGQGLTRDQAIDLALKNNLGIRTAGFEVEGQRQLKKSSFDLPKTEVTLMYGQYNSYAKNDNNITVSQSIPFSSFGSQGKLNKSLLASAELKKRRTTLFFKSKTSITVLRIPTLYTIYYSYRTAFSKGFTGLLPSATRLANRIY
jgi:cobalt-zinc-cadmium resistance protein CzcA